LPNAFAGLAASRLTPRFADQRACHRLAREISGIISRQPGKNFGWQGVQPEFTKNLIYSFHNI
jgi:hypothetical protein